MKILILLYFITLANSYCIFKNSHSCYRCDLIDTTILSSDDYMDIWGIHEDEFSDENVECLYTETAIFRAIPDNINNFENLDYLRISNFLYNSTLPKLNITTLHLTDNVDLEFLPNNVFSGAPYLRNIIISMSPLTYIQEGAFWGLTNVESIDLSYISGYTKLEKIFLPLKSIKTIEYTHSSLVDIHQDAFDNLNKLIYINLDDNNVKLIRKGTFFDLASLERISIRRNWLTTISPGAFQNLPNLSQLLLSDNELTYLPEGVFLDLNELSVLSFSSNSIGIIEHDVFSGGLPTLKFLDLSENVCTSKTYVGNQQFDIYMLLLNTNCIQ